MAPLAGDGAFVMRPLIATGVPRVDARPAHAPQVGLRSVSCGDAARRDREAAPARTRSRKPPDSYPATRFL